MTNENYVEQDGANTLRAELGYCTKLRHCTINAKTNDLNILEPELFFFNLAHLYIKCE